MSTATMTEQDTLRLENEGWADTYSEGVWRKETNGRTLIVVPPGFLDSNVWRVEMFESDEIPEKSEELGGGDIYKGCVEETADLDAALALAALWERNPPQLDDSYLSVNEDIAVRLDPSSFVRI